MAPVNEKLKLSKLSSQSWIAILYILSVIVLILTPIVVGVFTPIPSEIITFLTNSLLVYLSFGQIILASLFNEAKSAQNGNHNSAYSQSSDTTENSIGRQ